jgi:hypothetical protein
VTLAEAYGWTPAECDRLDPDFVDELLIRRTARADHELFGHDAKGDAEVRRHQDRRRRELMEWRRGEHSGT